MPPSPEIESACKALDELRRPLADAAKSGELTSGLVRAVTDDCADPVLITDQKARIVLVNGPAARLLGMSTRELQELTLWDITHTTYQADFDILWRAFLRAGRQRGRSGVRHQDGSVVEVAYCAEVDVWTQSCLFLLRRLG